MLPVVGETIITPKFCFATSITQKALSWSLLRFIILSMDHFSWTDTVKAALSPCFSCLQTTPAHTNVNDQPRNSTLRTDLEGLLTDPVDTDNEAETLSLHS